MDRKELFWCLWCEQIQSLLTQKEKGSSLSEASAASSASSSTLYLLSSDLDLEDKYGKKERREIYRLLPSYGGAGDNSLPLWTRKDVYLGPSYNELGPKNYTPIHLRFAETSHEYLRFVFIFIYINLDIYLYCFDKILSQSPPRAAQAS